MNEHDSRHLIYCVTRRERLEPDSSKKDVSLEGCRGEAVCIVDTGELGVAISSLGDSNLLRSPQPEDLETYERVVEWFFERGPVVPLQFGHTVEHPDDLAATLHPHADDFQRMLDRFEGHVEVSLRLFVSEEELEALDTPSAPSAEPEDHASGADYLQARRRQLQAEDSIDNESLPAVDQLLDVLEPLTTALKTELSRDSDWFEGPNVAIYALTPRDTLSTLWEHLDAFEADIEAKLESTGPWPPYNFV